MNTPLTPLRRKRCETLLKGSETITKFAAEQIAFLARTKTEEFLAMLTDEAVEQLAFKYMRDRTFTNKLHARNRALDANRTNTLQGV